MSDITPFVEANALLEIQVGNETHARDILKGFSRPELLSLQDAANTLVDFCEDALDLIDEGTKDAKP